MLRSESLPLRMFEVLTGPPGEVKSDPNKTLQDVFVEALVTTALQVIQVNCPEVDAGGKNSEGVKRAAKFVRVVDERTCTSYEFFNPTSSNISSYDKIRYTDIIAVDNVPRQLKLPNHVQFQTLWVSDPNNWEKGLLEKRQRLKSLRPLSPANRPMLVLNPNSSLVDITYFKRLPVIIGVTWLDYEVFFGGILDTIAQLSSEYATPMKMLSVESYIKIMALLFHCELNALEGGHPDPGGSFIIAEIARIIRNEWLQHNLIQSDIAYARIKASLIKSNNEFRNTSLAPTFQRLMKQIQDWEKSGKVVVPKTVLPGSDPAPKLQISAKRLQALKSNHAVKPDISLFQKHKTNPKIKDLLVSIKKSPADEIRKIEDLSLLALLGAKFFMQDVLNPDNSRSPFLDAERDRVKDVAETMGAFFKIALNNDSYPRKEFVAHLFDLKQKSSNPILKLIITRIFDKDVVYSPELPAMLNFEHDEKKAQKASESIAACEDPSLLAMILLAQKGYRELRQVADGLIKGVMADNQNWGHVGFNRKENNGDKLAKVGAGTDTATIAHLNRSPHSLLTQNQNLSRILLAIADSHQLTHEQLEFLDQTKVSSSGMQQWEVDLLKLKNLDVSQILERGYEIYFHDNYLWAHDKFKSIYLIAHKEKTVLYYDKNGDRTVIVEPAEYKEFMDSMQIDFNQAQFKNLRFFPIKNGLHPLALERFSALAAKHRTYGLRSVFCQSGIYLEKQYSNEPDGLEFLTLLANLGVKGAVDLFDPEDLANPKLCKKNVLRFLIDKIVEHSQVAPPNYQCSEMSPPDYDQVPSAQSNGMNPPSYQESHPAGLLPQTPASVVVDAKDAKTSVVNPVIHGNSDYHPPVERIQTIAPSRETKGEVITQQSQVSRAENKESEESKNVSARKPKVDFFAKFMGLTELDRRKKIREYEDPALAATPLVSYWILTGTAKLLEDFGVDRSTFRYLHVGPDFSQINNKEWSLKPFLQNEFKREAGRKSKSKSKYIYFVIPTVNMQHATCVVIDRMAKKIHFVDPEMNRNQAEEEGAKKLNELLLMPEFKDYKVILPPRKCQLNPQQPEKNDIDCGILGVMNIMGIILQLEKIYPHSDFLNSHKLWINVNVGEGFGLDPRTNEELTLFKGGLLLAREAQDKHREDKRKVKQSAAASRSLSVFSGNSVQKGKPEDYKLVNPQPNGEAKIDAIAPSNFSEKDYKQAAEMGINLNESFFQKLNADDAAKLLKNIEDAKKGRIHFNKGLKSDMQWKVLTNMRIALDEKLISLEETAATPWTWVPDTIETLMLHEKGIAALRDKAIYWREAAKMQTKDLQQLLSKFTPRVSIPSKKPGIR